MRNKDATSFGGSQVLAQTNASGSSTAPAQSAVQSDSAAVGNDVEVADSEAVPDGMSDPEVVDTTTEDFLTAVLPAPNGERCFYYGSGKDKPSDTKTPARSHRDLMSVGQTTNNDRRSPKQFWFATAAHSYLNAMRPIAKGGSKSTKDGGRAAHNVEARKCFSIDIDLDASGYKKSKPCHKTVGEALIALREDCKAGGFPQPAFIVSSGYGLHCYWAFDGDVPLDRWREAATKFKRFMKRCEKRAADTSRWSDPNGYLRLPGTHNKKNMNEPRLVKIIGGTGANHSFDKLEAVLAKVAGDGAKEQVDKLISSFTSKAAATADPEIGSGYPSYFSVMRALPLVSADDRDIWLRFAAFMKSWGRVHSQPLAAFEMFVAWARTSGEFDKVGKDGLSGDAACRKLWGSVADGEHAGKVTFGTIRRFANEASAKKDHAYADECLARASIMAEKLNGIESIKEATKAAVDSLTFDKFLEESPPVIPHDQVWLMWRLWNRENCVVKRGGKTVYMQQLRETRELKIGGTAMPYEHITDSYSRKSDLCEYRGVVNYEREEVRADGTKVIDEETGRPKIVTRNLVNTWLKSTDRRAYQHVGFYPGTKVPERHANLWTGFRTEPRAGDWSKLRNHIKDNICQGDEQSFAWLMTWMAHMFQRPWEKPGTCVALRGGKGVGKSKLSQWLRFVIGQASFTASSSEHVTGRFNAHLETALLLCCEEAFWAGDKKAESVLKDLITSDSIAIERKGLDAFVAPNYTRLLITSNASHAFPASFDERRLFMLTVGNARANDHQYFGEIDEQMLAGGAAAMLHELVNWDLNRAKVRQAPKNHALAEQVIAGLRGLDRWFHEVMITGSITCTPKGAEGSTVALANTATTSVDCGTVLASTEAYTDGRFSTKASATTVGTWLHANVPGLGRHRKPLGSGAPGSARSWHYRFPPLENMRAEYERKLGTALAALGAVDDAASKKVNQFIDALVASKTFDEVRAELDDLYDRNAIDEYRFYEAAIASAEADGLASAAARLKRERDEFVQAEAEL